MKSDSVPAFALEKEALKTEIEAGTVSVSQKNLPPCGGNSKFSFL